MSAALSKVAPRWGPVVVPLIVLVVGLMATGWLTMSARREMLARDAERFQHEADQLVARFDTRLKTYAQALMGMRQWYAE